VRHRCGEQFARRAQRRLDRSWVATSDDHVVGFVVAVDDEVEQLYVDRAERGSGVAAALLRRAEAEIRAGGHRCAWLAVVAGNRRARAFYTREGWHDSGLVAYEAETEDGSFTVPAHRYEIDLRGDHPDGGGSPALTTRRSSRRVGAAWSPQEAFRPAPAVGD
ncbi:MAG TPA: GNAT family N-acetyltransferase, partial [Ilumatobacteraceae bacterium]|nr:GNAT family N-acetyltransferase [Ilumatobacteraceae bacterium]